MQRRRFMRKVVALAAQAGALAMILKRDRALADQKGAAESSYGMGIQVEKCIGCSRCVEACKEENGVPKEPFFYRTWVEQYSIKTDGSVTVRTTDPSGVFPEQGASSETLRSFFVPKLCNQCDNPPCVQVCPVGATFKTADGVVLVDDARCIGCRYCIQACPYGARYLHPDKGTADKCTFCYQRITKNLLPACVEVCPTQTRVFGNLKVSASPLTRFKRMNRLHVLKPYMNTEPKVLYSGLDGVVK